MNTSTVLQTENLNIGYRRGGGARIIAAGVQLALRAGELVCMLGPNGVGKSTLLRTLCGLQPALAGAVIVGQTQIAQLDPLERAKLFAVVLTERFESARLNVRDLVSLGRLPHTGWAGRLTDDDRATVDWAMSAASCAPLAARWVAELSDGERQRVLIARALAQQPRILILDEPTAYLDLPHRVDILRLLHRLSRQTGQAILISTHDLELALHFADRLWVMTVGGTIKTGLPEELVLDGTLASAFACPGMWFDPQDARFRMNPGSRETIVVTGSSLAATWTVRALERLGFRPVRIAAQSSQATASEVVPKESSAELIPTTVEIVDQSNGTIWRLILASQVSEHKSLEDLARQLEHALPAK